MPKISIEVQLSSEELLKAVEQLSLPEFEQFKSQIIALQAKRRTSALPQKEAELLTKINQGIPPESQKYYQQLIAKREAEILTDTEYNRLLTLSEEIEKIAAKRLEYLVELANIRGVSLVDLMENLGIKTEINV